MPLTDYIQCPPSLLLRLSPLLLSLAIIFLIIVTNGERQKTSQEDASFGRLEDDKLLINHVDQAKAFGLSDNSIKSILSINNNKKLGKKKDKARK